METKEPKGDGAKSMAAKSEAKPEPTPTVQAPATPAAAAAPETVTLTKAELQQMMRDSANEAAGRVRRDFDEYLKNTPAAAAAARDTVVMVAKPHRDIGEETTKALAAREDELAKKNADLLEGPRVFQCSCASQPRQDRMVGAMDALHAKAKYEAYYGITGSMDGQARVKVDEVTPEPAVA